MTELWTATIENKWKKWMELMQITEDSGVAQLHRCGFPPIPQLHFDDSCFLVATGFRQLSTGLPDSKCLWICVGLREVLYQRNFSTLVNNGNESKATNSWRSLVILQPSHLTTLRIPSALIASRWCQRCLVFGLMFLSDQMMVTTTRAQKVAKEG